MTDARSPLRAFRAAIFAAVGVSLAAVGHSSMSGQDVPFGALLVAFVVTGLAAWGVGHRRRGIPSIATGLLAMQAALHLTFAGSQTDTASMGGSHMGGSHSHGHMGGSHASGAPASGAGAHLDHSSLGMLAVHVLAALVCALWLARGEAAFFQLLAAVDSLAFAPLRLLLTAVRLPLPPRLTRRPRPRPVARARAAVLAYAVTRRGPPAQGLLLRPAPLAS
ncbi:hypothetical protein [Streptomyces cavernicola]|uniref:Integral-membrane protein n=1 Tax=Streptomyces cavernicola TaxID=3043613 RepID=A0ABT6S4Z0_9ACTN|nr:hypothetical protein [Streptomyces sp. B-S-A6]MDI3403150.1 hypothetical protein [Streptomyces sp. B-S-A6]